MSCLLSILIPTVWNRDTEFTKLYLTIDKQVSLIQSGQREEKGCTIKKFTNRHEGIELISAVDGKNITIGEKRELLYKEASGLFSWQIDDDDSIAPNAIKLILEAIKDGQPRYPTPKDWGNRWDCITFEEHIDIDGKIQRSNHSLKYDDWHDNFDGYDYVRTPFMKSVIRTDIARSVPIPHIRFGEDHQWAQALKPHLKTEMHIDEQVYKYIHRSSDHNTRYGIK